VSRREFHPHVLPSISRGSAGYDQLQHNQIYSLIDEFNLAQSSIGSAAVTNLGAEETRELGASVRAACERYAGENRVRDIAYEGEGFDRELWSVLCEQIGVAAVAAPEDLGGGGFGTRALGVVAHELGRALAPVPFLPTAVYAVGLLADAGDAEKVEALVSGKRTAAVAADERNDAVTAVRVGNQWTLSGTMPHVMHAAAADELLVAARTDGGIRLYAVDPGDARVTVTPERVLDPTRPLATVVFDGASAETVGDADSAEAAIAANTLRTIAVLAAEQVGAHERLVEMAADYAKTRQQFGRPIGAFQAVKHRCADMLTNLEWSRSASLAALQAIDDGSVDAPWLTSLAKAVCSEGLRDAAHANLQIHGGIGFTWEDASHLYLRRARTDEVLFGGPSSHWERVATGAELFA
jgi:alkylation response protein AidB-like acyl-CoA dehydrogenase